MNARKRNRTLLASLVLALFIGGYFAATSHSNSARSLANVAKKPLASASAAAPSESSSPVPSADIVSSESAAPVETNKAVPTASSDKRTLVVKQSTKPVNIVVSPGTTVATRTQSGIQTTTVKTKRVVVSVTPVPVASPSAGATPKDKMIAIPCPTGFPKFNADGTPMRCLEVIVPTPVPAKVLTWDGFVAPNATFDKITYCVRSTVLEQNLITGQMEYFWDVKWQIKITGGHFNYQGTAYNQNDILRLPDSMHYHDIGMDVPVLSETFSLYVSPMNWRYGDENHPIKEIVMNYDAHFTQKQCDAVGNG